MKSCMQEVCVRVRVSQGDGVSGILSKHASAYLDHSLASCSSGPCFKTQDWHIFGTRDEWLQGLCFRSWVDVMKRPEEWNQVRKLMFC